MNIDTTDKSLLARWAQFPLLYRMTTGFMILAGLFILIRLAIGLGPTTNMNDGYPWGIWIVYDVVVGTALGTGGFLMAIIIYLFNKWEYHPLIRSAIMTSAFGYTIAGISVIIDLGRWFNFYSLLMPWRYNAHSVLLEVALCIMGYTMVTWIELFPAFVEKKDQYKFMQFAPLRKAAEFIANNPKKWNRILVGVIALGILLPTMHQSSLGSMMVIAGNKVHPLWQAGFQPILFLFSVAFMGYSMVVVEAFAARNFFNVPCECNMIRKLVPTVASIATLWIIMRFSSLYFEGKYHLILTSGMYSITFFLETAMVLMGTYMLIRYRYAGKPKRIFAAAFLLVFAGALYRFNVYLIAYDPGQGYTYFPSVMETAITFGFVAAELTLYFVFIRSFSILHSEKK